MSCGDGHQLKSAVGDSLTHRDTSPTAHGQSYGQVFFWDVPEQCTHTEVSLCVSVGLNVHRDHIRSVRDGGAVGVVLMYSSC